MAEGLVTFCISVAGACLVEPLNVELSSEGSLPCFGFADLTNCRGREPVDS
jgi:hypothetical protein